METENDSPDELKIVYPTLSRDLAPSRACATGEIVPLKGLRHDHLADVWSKLFKN